MQIQMTDQEIETFLATYGDGLGQYDAVGSAALWGMPGMIISDAFVGVLSSREEMAQRLSQAYPFYRRLGLARVSHTVLERADVTPHIIRLRVRWHFFASDDELLTDGDYEYTLRRDDDGLHVYVAISIDEAEKITDLARRKGIDLPEAST